MKKILLGITSVAVVVVATWLISPLFFNKVVDEALPEDLLSQEELVDTMMPPPAEIGLLSREQKLELEREITNALGDEFDNEVRDDMPDMPQELFSKEGSFKGADRAHQGSGQARLIFNENSESLLRLEDFSVTNGPDLFVVLSTEADPITAGLGEMKIIERLKGNKGNQNYLLDLTKEDFEKYKSVVIYCRAFSVLFSSAPLQ